MNYKEFLDRVISEGIEAAKHDYSPEEYSGDSPTQRGLLRGSVAGFEACRDKSIVELAHLLEEARSKGNEAFRHSHAGEVTLEEYWYARGFELEVEWVCNCLSAVLHHEGLPIIIPPTARGMLKAAEIVGVKSED